MTISGKAGVLTTSEAQVEFFSKEAWGGIVLVIMAVIAVIVANSPLEPFYQAFLDLHLEVRLAPAEGPVFEIDKPLLLWINDGLMAVFFFLVGLEIKREFLEGELSSFSQAILPGVAAIGGMAVPALLYVAINAGQPQNLQGWAIPAATDIAFALGVLALLGQRVPVALKVLLTAIAIYDDVGAILIIAVFYTDKLSMVSLALAAVALAALISLNLSRVTRIAPYILIGGFLWVCVLKSGVHATIAGVLLALTIPMRDRERGGSPLKHLEHTLHPWSSFLVLPVFAFANAGVSFAGISLSSLIEPVTLGIAAGLFVGKQIGVFGSLYLMLRYNLSAMPEGANLAQLYGVALLCGVGFTMSLFIGGLAWQHAEFEAPVRLGVMTGSVLSAVSGFLLLRFVTRAERSPQTAAETG